MEILALCTMAVCASQLACKIIFLTLSKCNDSNEQTADKSDILFIDNVCPQYIHRLEGHQCLPAVSLYFKNLGESYYLGELIISDRRRE